MPADQCCPEVLGADGDPVCLHVFGGIPQLLADRLVDVCFQDVVT